MYCANRRSDFACWVTEDERKKRSINEMFGDDSNDEDEEDDIRPGRSPAWSGPPCWSIDGFSPVFTRPFFLFDTLPQCPRARPPPTPLGA